MKYLPNLRLKLILVFFVALVGLVLAATWATGGIVPANAEFDKEAVLEHVLSTSDALETKTIE